jgi:hypothetical protein
MILRFLRAAWRTASSRGVAVLLLLAIAAVALVGGTVAQLSAAGVPWAVPGPHLHPLIRLLHLNDLFAARWVLVLAGLLMLNLLLCTLSRARPSLVQPEQMRGLLHFRQLATSIPVDESWLIIGQVLDARRFRVRTRIEVGRVLWTARRNRLGQLGSLIFHLSLVVALVGVALRSKRGFEGEFVLFPDQAISLVPSERDTLQVQLVESGTDYDLAPEGRRPASGVRDPSTDDGRRARTTNDVLLRQRHSQIVLYDNGRFDRTTQLSINHPAGIAGINLYQGDPAQIFVLHATSSRQRRPETGDGRPADFTGRRSPVASLLHLRDTTLRVRENETFALDAAPSPRYFFSLANLGSTWLHDSMVGSLPVQAALFRFDPSDSGAGRQLLVDTLRMEQPAEIDGRMLSLINIHRGTWISYRYDPALPWLYFAGAAFLLGILLRGFLPAYELSGSVTEEQGETIIRFGGRALGLFTSLRPLARQIVDRFEGE